MRERGCVVEGGAVACKQQINRLVQQIALIATSNEEPDRRASNSGTKLARSGARRAVWRAMDWTVDRLFFTRWFNSLMSTRC